MATKEGCIITGTNARPSIAPTFGVDNMLGTNSAFGFPTDEEFPFVLIVTSITQGKSIFLPYWHGYPSRNGNWQGREARTIPIDIKGPKYG